MGKSRKTQLIFVLLIVVYAIYAALYIYRNSVVVDGQRYFVLFDDAMISMRYARNLVDGNGLVWNPGERVEGFTNPLWVLLMAVFHWLPLPAPWMGLPVQVAGAVFFGVCLYVIRQIGDEIFPGGVVGLLAVALGAFYGQINTWNLLGMEVSLVLLITTWAVWIALRILKGGAFSGWLYLLLGLGTLLRIDMAVPFLAIGAFMVVFDSANRQKHLLWGISSLAAFLGGQTLLRFWYYGEWLPNTYYLKVTGAPIWLTLKNGLFVFLKFAWRFNPALLFLPAIFALTWRVRSIWRERAPALLLAWVFAAFCAYSIYVGGDSWEEKGGANRFIATGLPLLFILLAGVFESIWVWMSHVDADGQVEGLLQFGVMAFAWVGLAELSSLRETEFLSYWLMLMMPIAWLAACVVLAAYFPKHKRWLWAGMTAGYTAAVVVFALYSRYIANGNALSPVVAESVSVIVERLLGFSAAWFWLPWVVVWMPRRRWTVVLAWVLFAVGAGAMFVDGRAWSSIGGADRLFAAILPQICLLLAWSFAARPSPIDAGGLKRVVWAVTQGVVVLICLVNFNALLEMKSLKYSLLFEKHPFTVGSERILRIAGLVEQVSNPEARVAVVTAGIIPYYTNRVAIDLLGKADKFIARQPMHITPGMPLVNYRPGHMKWDYTYSIRDLQPDVIAQLYDDSPPEERLQWVTGYYTSVKVGTITFYVRNDSPYIHWDAVGQLQEK